MNKILKNNDGITLIETVVSTAIIMIILVSVVGALLYGQKMIVFTDTKNNAAAQAQELIDDIMGSLSNGVIPDSVTLGAIDVSGNTGEKFIYNDNEAEKKQYYLTQKIISDRVGYNINVRVYYNNGESYVDLTAYSKFYNNEELDKGGDFV